MPALTAGRVPGLTVLVADMGADAALRTRGDGSRVLVVNPHQTYKSAVSAVWRVLPYLSQDEGAAVVRRYLPDVVGQDKPGRWGHLFGLMLVLVLAGVLAWWHVDAAQVPPLRRAEVVWLRQLTGAECSRDDGWVAVCVADTMGSHTLRGWSGSGSVLVEAAAGSVKVSVLFVDDPGRVDDAARGELVTGHHAVGVVGGTHSMVVSGMDEDLVAALAAKFAAATGGRTV